MQSHFIARQRFAKFAMFALGHVCLFFPLVPPPPRAPPLLILLFLLPLPPVDGLREGANKLPAKERGTLGEKKGVCWLLRHFVVCFQSQRRRRRRVNCRQRRKRSLKGPRKRKRKAFGTVGGREGKGKRQSILQTAGFAHFIARFFGNQGRALFPDTMCSIHVQAQMMVHFNYVPLTFLPKKYWLLRICQHDLLTFTLLQYTKRSAAAAAEATRARLQQTTARTKDQPEAAPPAEAVGSDGAPEDTDTEETPSPSSPPSSESSEVTPLFGNGENRLLNFRTSKLTGEKNLVSHLLSSLVR